MDLDQIPWVDRIQACDKAVRICALRREGWVRVGSDQAKMSGSVQTTYTNMSKVVSSSFFLFPTVNRLSLFYRLPCMSLSLLRSIPSVLWHCWLGDMKDVRPVNISNQQSQKVLFFSGDWKTYWRHGGIAGKIAWYCGVGDLRVLMLLIDDWLSDWLIDWLIDITQ